MSTPNKDIVLKAGDLAVADMAPGGIMVTKQAVKFLRVAMKQNVLTSQVRSPLLDRETSEVDKMLWTGQVLHTNTPGVSLPSSYFAKPTFDKVPIVTKNYKGIVKVQREVYEDSIEQAALQATLSDMMSMAVANDLEEFLIKSDVASTTDGYNQQNGLLKLASSNVVDAGVASLNKDILETLYLTLPEEYDAGNLKCFTNRKARADFRATLGNRATVLGDTQVSGQLPADFGYDGVPLIRVPRFPNNLNAGGGSNETNVLYMDPQNAMMGFQRRVTLDTAFEPTAQVFIIVVTLRMGIQFEHEPAVAKAVKVLGQ